MKSGGLEPIEQQLLQALALAPRAPFSRLAQVLGVSDQTVARRYQRMRSVFGLRVLMVPDPRAFGTVSWFLRLQCIPDASRAVAAALAGRADTSWVTLASGGTEVDCLLQTFSDGDGSLLLERLAGSRRVLSITAHSVLHNFSPVVWQGLLGYLDEEQMGRLAIEPVEDGDPPRFDASDPADRVMLELLLQDGRTPYAELAAATGRDESTVRRRLEQMIRRRQAFFDIDIAHRAFGIRNVTRLWMSVAPAELHHVGETLAAQREVPIAAATTGPTNLMAAVHSEGPDALYRFVTERVGALAGVLRVEMSPTVATLKRVARVPAGSPE